MLGVSVARPGPPPVRMKKLSKTLKASISRSSTMTASSGVIIGNVSWKKIWIGARAVDRGGSEGIERQRLQAGEEGEHHERRPLPDVDQDQRIKREIGRGEDRGVPQDAEALDDVVGEEPPGAREHDLPDQPNHDRRHHGGDEQERHKEGAAADLWLSTSAPARPSMNSIGTAMSTKMARPRSRSRSARS